MFGPASGLVPGVRARDRARVRVRGEIGFGVEHRVRTPGAGGLGEHYRDCGSDEFVSLCA